MNLTLKRQIEQELKERNGSAYSNLIKANTELVDKIKWIKEDIEREIKKINELDITKEQIIEDLEKLLKNNN